MSQATIEPPLATAKDLPKANPFTSPRAPGVVCTFTAPLPRIWMPFTQGALLVVGLVAATSSAFLVTSVTTAYGVTVLATHLGTSPAGVVGLAGGLAAGMAATFGATLLVMRTLSEDS